MSKSRPKNELGERDQEWSEDLAEQSAGVIYYPHTHTHGHAAVLATKALLLWDHICEQFTC